MSNSKKAVHVECNVLLIKGLELYLRIFEKIKILYRFNTNLSIRISSFFSDTQLNRPLEIKPQANTAFALYTVQRMLNEKEKKKRSMTLS